MSPHAIAKRLRAYRKMLRDPHWKPWWHEIEVRLFWYRGRGPK